MTVSADRKDRFILRKIGRELAAIGLVKTKRDYVEIWLSGDEGQTIDTVPLTQALFVSLNMGLVLHQMELETDAYDQRKTEASWAIRAKLMVLNRIVRHYGTWIDGNAAFRPEIGL